MQIENFYRAQSLRKEILELQAVIAKTDEGNLSFLETLSAPHKENMKEKALTAVKKELIKVVKQLEKEFNDL